MSNVLALIFVFCILASTPGASPFGNDSRSGNGRYSVELTRNAEGKLLVAVFQHTNDLKALSWSKPIDWQEPYPGWSGGVGVWDVKAMVSGNGKTVILRDWGTPEEKNGVRIIGPGEKEDH